MISNTTDLADNNKNIILNVIRDKGPISRADLSRMLEISKPAVSKNVRELIDAQMIVETGNGNNDLGRKSTLLVFNAEKAYVVGIDIGNFKTRVGLSNMTGKLIQYLERENLPCLDGEEIINSVDESIQSLCSLQGIETQSIAAICVGIPGVNDTVSNKNLLTPFIENWEDLDIATFFQSRYNTQVIVRNNVNLAAIGEYQNRPELEQEIGSMFYVNFGIGIGAGLILDRKLFSGKNNAAGEIGFCCFQKLAYSLSRRSTGSFEQEVSVKCLLDRYNGLVDEDRRLELNNQGVSELFDRYDRNEKTANVIVGGLMENLLMMMISATAILNTEVIVIGGGLGQRISPYFPQFERALAENVPFPPTIRRASLDVMSGVYGAIADAMAEVMADYRNLERPGKAPLQISQ